MKCHILHRTGTAKVLLGRTPRYFILVAMKELKSLVFPRNVLSVNPSVPQILGIRAEVDIDKSWGMLTNVVSLSSVSII